MQDNRDLRKLLLTPEEWDHVSQAVDNFRSFNNYSKKLQSITTTLSDFYGYWMIMKIKLSKADDPLSHNMLEEMNKYHDMLMENPVILASLYLDPRYQRGLKEKKSLAIDFLVDLYARQTRVEQIYNAAHTIIDVMEEKDDNESNSFEELDNYLNASKSIDPSNNIQTNSDTIAEVRALLEQFWNVQAPLKSSVLDFWEKNKIDRPILYQLSSVLNAIPPTQTTVERAFSVLALTLTSHRVRLGDDCLQNILLIRLNSDVCTEDNTCDVGAFCDDD